MAIYSKSIPSALSTEEFGNYTINQIAESFHDFDKSIGLEELAVLEANGEQTDYAKAEKKNKFFDKIIEVVEAIWTKIKGLYTKALTSLKGVVDKFKANFESKLLDKVKKNVKFLKDESYGKTYDYAGYDDAISGKDTTFNAVKSYYETIGETESEAYKKYSKLSSDADVTKAVENLMSNISTAKGNLARAIGAGNTAEDLKSDKINSAITKTIRGQEIDMNKLYIVANIDSMVKSASDFGATASKVKHQYDSVKSGFETIKKNIKADKAKQKDVSERIYNAYFMAIKEAIVTTTCISNITLKITSEKLSRDQRVVAKLAVAMRKIDKMDSATIKSSKKAVGESATFESQLNSLFMF